MKTQFDYCLKCASDLSGDFCDACGWYPVCLDESDECRGDLQPYESLTGSVFARCQHHAAIAYKRQDKINQTHGLRYR
jgi:hypothetical protein